MLHSSIGRLSLASGSYQLSGYLVVSAWPPRVSQGQRSYDAACKCRYGHLSVDLAKLPHLKSLEVDLRNPWNLAQDNFLIIKSLCTPLRHLIRRRSVSPKEFKNEGLDDIDCAGEN